jgi:cysteine synthase
MNRILENLTDAIGNTPMVELKKYRERHGLESRILVKLEYLNPSGSVKCRIGKAMIEEAEKKGLIQPGGMIIEPTSGNTGIALAFVAKAKGYGCTLVMPDTMSVERRHLIKAYGGNVVLTPGAEGMKGAIQKAKELLDQNPNAYMPSQFNNPANPEIHRKTTAEEIWNSTEGKVDILVAGVGTGGTITGVGEVLKERNPKVKVVAVEPFDSPVLSGGVAGPHKIQGIGAGFIPEILNRKVIDEVIQVRNEEAFRAVKNCSETEGIFCGISSGAALFAGGILGRRAENREKIIVVILPDGGERYLSIFSQE